jgi:signal transduction histidine kinase
MNDDSANLRASMRDLLAKMSRYEALLELTGVINGASDIESVGTEMARRLKYIVDVYSWRYICFEGDPEDTADSEVTTIVVDGDRGRADVRRTTPSALSSLELDLWHDRKTRMLCGETMSNALEKLPGHFRKDDLEQISVNALVEHGKTQALYLFCKRRQPFTDLDAKCLSVVCSFFHRKIIMLWEQQKLRDLELAYLQQEVMLRQSERLATLGRLSAGMAHELNNPAAAAKHGAEQLKTAIARVERAQYALGAGELSGEQQEVIAEFEKQAGERAKKPRSLDPIARSDLEQEVEGWLDRNGIQDPWEHAPTFVTMGLDVVELEDLSKNFDPSMTPIVIDCVGSRFAALSLLEDVGRGARRIAEVVKALKGYSFMDQAPVQLVDVREGLDDTLVMLSCKLRAGINVNLNYADPLPRILGHGSELNQVWTNIIDNAISAMGDEGALDLKAYRDDDWVVVEVADNGPGIPVEVQGKIFDPFFTTKAPGEGAGLGLSISHGIVVEKHRGQISVCSKPGATRFAVKLPISDQPSTVGEDGGAFTENTEA